MNRVSIAIVMLLNLNRALAFSMTPNIRVHLVQPKIRSTSLHSSTTRTGVNEIEALNKQQVAKQALTKLLEKQRKELLATEELIRNLKISELDREISDLHNSTDGSHPQQDASSLAASIYAGADYGFNSRSDGCRFEDVEDLTDELFTGYGPPSNIFSLGKQQFMRNLNAMRGEYADEQDLTLTPDQKILHDKLETLTLNSTAIWEREAERGEVVAPLVIKIPYYALCYLMDEVFEGRYVFSRFFLLETVARMPYFSYITMLHLYETLGFWRRSSEVKRVHFAEEWNEYHHLLIMESLGGDQSWWVRFTAQHSALVYFLVLTHLFALSPSLSYKFSEMLETHAVDTYGVFIEENEEILKTLPPSWAALEYYALGISDPMFGEYQTTAAANGGEIRRSGNNMTSLFDVFQAIRADEGDHVGTMKACLDPSVPVLSPALETRVLVGFALAASVGYFVSTGDFLSTEIIDGLDDAVMSDTLVDVILGGAAAVFGGLNKLQVDADIGAEVEEIAKGGGLLYSLKQAWIGAGALVAGLGLNELQVETETATEIEEIAAVGGLQALLPFLKNLLLRLL